MKKEILIIGGGGREHALAWKLAQDTRAHTLYVAPGNAGTEVIGENVPIRAENIEAIVAWATDHSPDMVVVGPEVPLALGLTDRLQEYGMKVFGPTRAAAEIEWSKSFAKDFMSRHHIPTARYGVFDDFASARQYIGSVSHPIVIKASGLASGKGVILPDSQESAITALQRIMEEKTFGGAGDVVVIEERLSGPEVSVMAITDGETIASLLPVRDHKRLMNGDAGPNTGGMGAICPVAMDAETFSLIRTDILERAVYGLRHEGRLFQGVLFAGLMLTPDGPKVLEFNSRFGDPETQAVIRLLDTNILELMEAVTQGRLRDVSIRWKNGYSVCVVLAARGYPDKPKTKGDIYGIENDYGSDVVIFQAGTTRVGQRTITSSGRVLGISGVGNTLIQAQRSAYAPIGVGGVWFDGMQYRTDIGNHTYGQ